MLVKRMSAREARNNFSDVLGSVYYSKEAIIVEKQGRPFAVVVSVDDYEQLLEEHRRDVRWPCEVGTGMAALSLYVALWARLRGVPFLTVDDGSSTEQ